MLVDMKLPELLAYQGRNPKPQDFDAFWDKSLADLAALDPQCEWVPAKFQTVEAECFDLFFTGMGGSRIHAKFARPRKAEDRKGPAVVLYHGYSGNAGDWIGLLPYVCCGFTVASLDCRGQGGQSQDTVPTTGTTLNGHIIRGIDDTPDKLLFRNIFLDTAELVRIVGNEPYVDAARIGVTGGSQGGGLTLAAASLVPEINRAAPIYPFLSDYKRVWEMDLAKDAYQELKNYFRRHDPRHEREDAIWNQLGYIDIQNLTPRIRGTVKMFTGMMDTVCPPSTQFAAYNKITAPKSYVIYPDFGHEALPDAGDMILQFMLEMMD